MRILLTGATGFIGSRLLAALQLRGHEVWCAGRRPPPHSVGWMAIDFRRALRPAQWRPLLEGVDVVVNAVGIFRESGDQRFAELHDEAPRALFSACVEAGVQRVVQLSALGVEQRVTGYQCSKHAADAFLRALPIDGVVVQPSLVFGADGESAARLLTLAAMPLLLLPDGGRQRVQPVHVDDVVEAMCRLVEAPLTSPAGGRSVPLVGPEPITLHDYLQQLRFAVGLPPAAALPVPAALVNIAARLGARRGGLLDPDAVTMLRQGSQGPATAITLLLGRAPREASDFLIGEPQAALRAQARLGWLMPLLRITLGLVWIVTGLLSLGLFPREASYEMLGRAGIAPAFQPLMLDGAALLDLLLGVFTLWPPVRARWRCRLWGAQAALMALYMAVIAAALPEYWLHPFGPLLKNLPMLAVLLLLYVQDRDLASPPWPLGGMGEADRTGPATDWRRADELFGEQRDDGGTRGGGGGGDLSAAYQLPQRH
jgi:uncharacterized protein YbjT (DUF2867 family)